MSSETRSDDSRPSPPDATDVGERRGRYLLAVYRRSDGGERVATGELERAVGVSGATVTERMRALDEEGLVDYRKYRGVVLTPTGEAIAARLARRFCVVGNFFRAALDGDLDDETAYEFGFALSAESVDRLRRLVDHPCAKRCPEAGRDRPRCLV